MFFNAATKFAASVPNGLLSLVHPVLATKFGGATVNASLGLLAFCLFAGSVAQAQKLEEWTDGSGVNKIQAKFLSLTDGVAEMQKADGSLIKVPLTKLSIDSQFRIRKAAEPKVFAEPKIVGDPKPLVLPESLNKTEPAVVSFPADASCQQFLEIIKGELVKQNVTVFWDAMPENYQKDINDVMHSGVLILDERSFNSASNLLRRAAKILVDKKDFVMASQYTFPNMPIEGRSEIQNNYDALAIGLQIFTHKDIMDYQLLSTGSVRSLLSMLGGLGQELQSSDMLSNMSPMMGMASLSNNAEAINFEVQELDPKRAMVRLMVEGQPPQQFTLENVNGRWLPADMVAQWDFLMTAAKTNIGGVTPEQKKIVANTIGTFTFAAGAIVGGLEQAQTQEEFDEVLAALMALAQNSGSSGNQPRGGQNNQAGGPGAMAPMGAPQGSSPQQGFRGRNMMDATGPQ